MKKLSIYALTALASSVALAGCYVDNGPAWSKMDEASSGPQVYTSIETDAQMQAEPGEGVGAFIEVTSDGVWHVYTTCDTVESNRGCNFRIMATVLSGQLVGSVGEEGLESEDNDWTDQDDTHALLDCMTYEGTDGMTFETDADARVRFTVYLDGYADPRFIYWVGDGAVHEGAPSDPIVLHPKAP